MSANCTFPKAVRLLTASDYSNVFQDVHYRASSQHFLILSKDQKSELRRLGIIVAKKNVKLAVQRNRIKRLIRESFRAEREKLPALDLIVLVKKGCDQLENKDLYLELDYVWRKLIRKVSK